MLTEESVTLDIHGKRVLVLGGYGLVGTAVCRQLAPHQPDSLIIASLRRGQAEEAAKRLRGEFPGSSTTFLPAWGDILLRSEWQEEGDGGVHPRVRALAGTERRRRLVADILQELDDDILHSSLLYQLVTGSFRGLGGRPVDIVIDCVNTATAVAYQNVFQTAQRLESRIRGGQETDWPAEVEGLLTSLYVPQLVRHMQILFDSMVDAGAQAYVKVGTSGTGGMGFNIPYTHGEERPSRVLLSKSAVAGAQSMLIFLMARTPGGPPLVKEIKPTAAIAWKGIGYGTIRGGGRDFPLYDCTPEQAYRLDDPATLAPQGDFGIETGEILESVYIDTGENGLFAVGEFTALTSLGQMEFVTPEEIAANVVAEIRGGNTGADIVAALDGAVMGPTYRAGLMRQAALERLHQLEAEHQADSVAFEMLGPPRLSKLLYEAYLLKRLSGSAPAVLREEPQALSNGVLELIESDAPLRQQIISIGIPILLPDGERLLRGPHCKANSAEHGWVDLRPENMEHWQRRLAALDEAIGRGLEADSSSRVDRGYPSLRAWRQDGELDVGEVVGWLFSTEEAGRRGKS
jgi:NAD(P)-dependent dehydrogenase (short-subunit alcohol dehydrogenase family)